MPKKIPLVLSAGKTTQLQTSDWVGPKQNVTNVSPTISNDNTQGYEPLSKWINTTNNKEYTCLIATTGAALWIETTAVTENSSFVFWPSAPAESGIVYKTWTNLMTAIASLAEGVVPTVTFKENFTVPTSGMPVAGWDMRGGTWKSPIMATGNAVVTVPDGVIIDNLVGVDVGLLVEFQPTTADGCLTYSLTPGLNIFQIGFGAKVANTGSKALVLSSGTGDTNVFVINGATIGIPPNDTAPWLKAQGTDGVIAISVIGSLFSQFPNDWLAGGNPGSSLTYNFNVGSITPTLSSWTGDAPTVLISARADKVLYDDSVVSVPSLGSNVQAALDAIKPLLGGGGGSPPSVTQHTDRELATDYPVTNATLVIVQFSVDDGGNPLNDPTRVSLQSDGSEVAWSQVSPDAALLHLSSPLVGFVEAGKAYRIESTAASKTDIPIVQEIAFSSGGGGGFDGYTDFVVQTGTGNIDSVASGSGPQVCIIFTGNGVVLEGLAAGADGKRVILKKVGTGTLTIKNNGSATPADIIGTNSGADIVLNPGEAIEVVYATAGPFWSHITSAMVPTGGGGGTNYGNTIIFDPDIGATIGNRYKTWAEVITALSVSPVYTQLLINKPGAFQTVTIPAGSYDLSKASIATAPGTIMPQVTFADGTTITGFPQRVEGVQLRNSNTSAPLFTVSGFAVCQVLDSSFVNITTATQPFWVVPASMSATLQVEGFTSPFFKVGSGSEPIEVHGSLSIDIIRIPDNSFFSQSDIFTNNLAGDGTITINSYVLLEDGYQATHTNFDGTLNVNQISEKRVNQLIDNKFEPVFLFDPSLSPGGNIFDDFTLLMNAAGAYSGKPLTIYFNLISNYSVPATTYNFSRMKFVHIGEYANSNSLDFADGVLVSEWPLESSVPMIFNNTSAPVSTITSGEKTIRLRGKASITNNGSQNVIQSSASGATAYIELHDESQISSPNAPVAKANASGSSVFITAFQYGNWNGASGAIDSVSGSTITIKNYTMRPGGYGIAANYGSGSVSFSHYYEDRVAELAGGGGVAGEDVVKVFHFDTGNSPAGNRYDDFTALMVAVNAAVSGGNFVDIYFKATGTVTVPAATYDFTNCRLLNEDIYGDQQEIEFDNGTLIPRFFYECNVNLRFVNASSSVTYFGAGDKDRIKIFGSAQISNAGDFPVFETNHATAFPRITFSDDASPATSGTAPVIRITLGTMAIVVNDRADVVNNAASPKFLDVASGKAAVIYNSTLMPLGVGVATDYGAGVVTIVGYGSDSGSGTFASGDLTWDGTPPSSFTSGTWSYVKIGKLVHLTMSAVYGAPGSANTEATLDISGFLPNIPTPVIGDGLPGSVTITGGARFSNLFFQYASSSVESKFESTNANRFTAQVTYESV